MLVSDHPGFLMYLARQTELIMSKILQYMKTQMSEEKFNRFPPPIQAIWVRLWQTLTVWSVLKDQDQDHLIAVYKKHQEIVRGCPDDQMIDFNLSGSFNKDLHPKPSRKTRPGNIWNNAVEEEPSKTEEQEPGPIRKPTQADVDEAAFWLEEWSRDHGS